MREPDETKTSSVFSQRVVRVGCEINVETTTGVEFYVPFGNRVIFGAVTRIHCGNYVLINSERVQTRSDRDSKQT